MAKRGEKRERRSVILELNAAGIDIGAEEIYVAAPPDRDEESTRRFSSFTCDRDRHGCQPVSPRLCLRLMAWPLPGKTSQRRQGVVL
jgi:hypothetical protein